MALSAVRLEPDNLQLQRARLRAVERTGDRACPTVSVIIPALNEAENLLHVLGNMPDECEVILVDGNSTDGTVEVARSLRPDVRVVFQTGVGKGNALACGFVAASGDVVVTIDADGSMDPKEIPAFVEAVVERPGTFAKGSRILPQAGSDDLTRVRRMGNRLLVWAVNVLYGTDYTDLCYGLNAFWRRDLDRLGFPRTETGIVAKEHQKLGFEVETYLNVRAARAGLHVVEIPSFEHHRVSGVGKLKVVRDGLRILRTILVERARRYPVTRPNIRSLSTEIGTGGRSLLTVTRSPITPITRSARTVRTGDAAGSAVEVPAGTEHCHGGGDRIAA